MMNITVDGKEYKIEFTFEAAECNSLIQKMFNVMSGAYLVKHNSINDLENAENSAAAMIDGASEMIADIPHICITAFYAGLLENNPLPQENAKQLMRAYMKENKLNYKTLYEQMRDCMEKDGFFELSGLTAMLQEMNGAQEETKSKKKSTGTK